MNVARPHNSTRYDDILIYIHYIYPLVLFVFFLVSLTWWSIATSQSSGPTPPPVNGVYQNGKKSKGKRRAAVHVDVADFEERKPGFWARFAARFPDGDAANKSLANERKLTPLRKAVLNWLLVGVIATFVANSANVVLHALTKSGWWCGKDYVISTVSLLFIYALLLISQLDGHLSPTLPHLLSWTVGLIGEGLLLATNILIYSENEDRKNRSPIKDVLFSNTGFDYHNIRWGSWSIINLTIDVLRIFLLVVLIGLYLVLVVFRSPVSEPEDAEETSPLLDSSASSTAGEADYGSIPAHTKHGVSEPSTNASAGWGRRAVLGKQSWWEYLRGYTIFFPYLWPSKSRRLQLMMILCFILVILQRGVNVLVPRQLGKITNILSGENGEPPKLPWLQILLYIIYRFLQGNMGVLGALRSTLWIPIGQYSYQALSTSAFEHVHSLSLDFHLGKKTGEVLSALSKGNAINTFLEQVSFQVVPMLVDLVVAVAYFWVSYDTYYALIVAIVTFWYLYITVRMAQWRADIRREMVNKSREEDAVKNDSMIAYETVKYFNAEGYEFSRYRAAVNAYQRAEYKVLLSLNVMNVTQNMVFTLGLVVACFLSAWQVSMGQIDVGKFVAMLAYLAQLQQPLNFFGTFYRSIQSSMINSERMLELFKEQPTVVDSLNAEKLTDCTGEIEFKNVHFAYDERKPALKGLSFTCAPGTTTAFVGESGGGKTTILRLLFRFYNIQSGSIEVDGKDVRDISIESLRENIGVVPQDTVLFNETIMYNLKYANPKATDEIVYEACRAASIHDKILSFPDGYNTKVGERGLRLSGGEKQRVAIARTILKNPKIILLDEATAALDSETEQYIQAALKELTKGRTTLVIAHRLSTITNANQILCIHEGQVAESGTHDELLARHGRYAMMWNKQIRAEKRKAKVAQMEEDLESDTPSIAPTPSVRTQTHNAPSFSIMEEPTLEAEAPVGEEEEEMLPEEAVMELPLEQNTAGAGPSTIVPNVEEIPKTLSVRIEDPISIPPTPSGAETPGRDSVASAPASPAASAAPPSRTPSGRTRTKSLSLRDGLRRSESGSSAGGSTSPKWSTKGLRKALGRKGTVLKKKEGPPGSSSAGGAAGSAASPGPGAGATGGEEAA